MKQQIKAAKLRVAVLEAELGECTTAAMDASVRASLDAATRRLRELESR